MKEKVLSVYFNEKNGRKAEVFKDEYHFGVRLYIKENRAWGYGKWVLDRTELLERMNERAAEDLAENYVQKWGSFKDAD